MPARREPFSEPAKVLPALPPRMCSLLDHPHPTAEGVCKMFKVWLCRKFLLREVHEGAVTLSAGLPPGVEQFPQ